MAENLEIIIKPPAGLGAAKQSLGDLGGLLADFPSTFRDCADESITQLLLDSGMLGNNVVDLILRETVGSPATRAGELKGFEVHPSDRYLELFTAVAAHWNAHVFFRHGWPILSLESDNASMAEAGGESIAPGGGLAQ